MTTYIQHVAWFFPFVILGTFLNFARKKAKGEKLTNWRLVEEIFSSIWISAIVMASLENFTNWSIGSIAAISSAVGFFHSRVIDIIGNDILVSLGKSISGFIKKKFQQ